MSPNQEVRPTPEQNQLINIYLRNQDRVCPECGENYWTALDFTLPRGETAGQTAKVRMQCGGCGDRNSYAIPYDVFLDAK